ncbi:MAG: SsrA-binding protein [candidate division WS6 bacterium GW2011_GWF2_39_15]|uniref:SsrA-binding protein n=1 Tax=candidate division WS6 bacterium GW2011_GWF2_39_15 TaxID=1619100 RepID=A0A0G0QXR7_9BACT|nr:MAG: SsrA-binding protein [candidate division WS6 bacterium GW2011_GWF2_39_15]
MLENRKAKFNYDIKETVEAGIILTGAEVKSIRDGRVDLKDSFVKVIGEELFLINADIARFKYANDPKYDSKKTRKLLVHRKELIQLASKSKQWGGTLVPLKMYFKHGRAKVLVGVGRGKKTYEKKNVQKERDLDRELHRDKLKYMVK